MVKEYQTNGTKKTMLKMWNYPLGRALQKSALKVLRKLL